MCNMKGVAQSDEIMVNHHPVYRFLATFSSLFCYYGLFLFTVSAKDPPACSELNIRKTKLASS